MRQTLNALPEKTRTQMVGILQQSLADTIDLMMQTKQAHWTIRGSDFIALHKLLDEIFEAISEHVDEQAERIAQLGGFVRGTVQAVADTTSLLAYSLEIENQDQILRKLGGAMAAVAKRLRDSIMQSTDAGDFGTSDIFTDASRDIEKYLWMVESHFADQASDGAEASTAILGRRARRRGAKVAREIHAVQR